MTDESRGFALGPNYVRFLLTPEQTAGTFSLTEFTAAPPPFPSAPPHIDRDADETLYIVESEFQFIRDGQTIPAPAGSYIFIPKGTRHPVENIGAAPGRMLVLLTPPGFEQFWKERAQLMATGGGVEPSALLALQEKYHLDTGGVPRQFSADDGLPPSTPLIK